MDIFKLTDSMTRKKILELFLSRPDKDYYLHELERELSDNAGNIRRELMSLIGHGLFQSYRKGRFVYYKINTRSPYYEAIKTLMGRKVINNIITEGFMWVTTPSPSKIPNEFYCQTRDIFQVRLQTFLTHLEEKIKEDAYLVAAIAGEIGNNSFDHNLGNWPDIPGVFFSHNEKNKIIVLADRGQGILATIRNIKPQTKDDLEALKIAFTQILSGRFGEKRGNGLKFVAQVIKDKKWSLRFNSGRAHLQIDTAGNMKIDEEKSNIHGCFAVIKYLP